jgi:hypothetical protein
MAEMKKITVNLPLEQITFLQCIAAREGISATDVLRRAIQSERFFEDREQAGEKVLVEKTDGSFREVIRK